jgi:hypothetical protein
VADTEIIRSENMGIGDQLQQGMGRTKKGAYITLPRQPLTHTKAKK